MSWGKFFLGTFIRGLREPCFSHMQLWKSREERTEGWVSKSYHSGSYTPTSTGEVGDMSILLTPGLSSAQYGFRLLTQSFNRRHPNGPWE